MAVVLAPETVVASGLRFERRAGRRSVNGSGASGLNNPGGDEGSGQWCKPARPHGPARRTSSEVVGFRRGRTSAPQLTGSDRCFVAASATPPREAASHLLVFHETFQYRRHLLRRVVVPLARVQEVERRAVSRQ
jgi:hypothetical protein